MAATSSQFGDRNGPFSFPYARSIIPLENSTGQHNNDLSHTGRASAVPQRPDLGPAYAADARYQQLPPQAMGLGLSAGLNALLPGQYKVRVCSSYVFSFAF